VVIAERATDAVPPAVAASATIARNDATWTLSWSNTSVPALVRYTHDGKRWTTLGVDLVGGRLSLDPQMLPGGGHGRFEIVLADGGGIIVVDGTPAVMPMTPNHRHGSMVLRRCRLVRRCCSMEGRRIARMARSTNLPGRSMACRQEGDRRCSSTISRRASTMFV
jgi:hypothetical protein